MRRHRSHPPFPSDHSARANRGRYGLHCNCRVCKSRPRSRRTCQLGCANDDKWRNEDDENDHYPCLRRHLRVDVYACKATRRHWLRCALGVLEFRMALLNSLFACAGASRRRAAWAVDRTSPSVECLESLGCARRAARVGPREGLARCESRGCGGTPKVAGKGEKVAG